MLNKSIAYRLTIFISVAVIFVFVGFMIISYFTNSKLIKNNIENKAISQSSEVIATIHKRLVTAKEVASNVADQIIFYSQHDHPDFLITGVLEKYPFLNAIRVNIDSGVPNIKQHYLLGFRESSDVLVEQGNELIYHCLNEKRIFEEVAKKEASAWTEVFTCSRNRKMVVAFYTPVVFVNKFNEKIKVGDVICELSLADLNNMIQNLNIGENGFAILFSKSGDYLAHPIEEWILNRNVFSLSDDVYDKKKTDVGKILREGLSGSLITYPEFRKDIKHWTYYTRLSEIDWTLVVVVPYSELYGTINLTVLRMLFVSILGIILIYIIVKLITNRLVEPLSEVTTQLKTFSSLTGKFDVNTLDEVKLVSQSLNYLKSWYEKYKISQSQEEVKSQKQMEDLMQASEIQQSLIKTDFSDIIEIKEIDLFALYKPAKIVSGDLFDYFFHDDEHLIFSIGDVSGKGVPAAIFMSIAQTLIKNNATIKSASKIVRRANKELYTTNNHQFFLTLFLGIFNIKTGVLEYCNAAHPPSYILKESGDVIELGNTHGLPLGLYSNKKYSESKITIEKGDTIVLYTDGITELENEQQIHFGNKRFKENLCQLTDADPKTLTTRIEKSLEIYKGNAKQTDDITLLTLKYKA